MKLQEDQQRLKGLLQETITLLCKNGLNYSSEFSVEALIVITLDQEKIFHTNIKETIAKESIASEDEDSSSSEVKKNPPVKPTHKQPKKRSLSDRSEIVSPKKGRRSVQDSARLGLPSAEKKSSVQTSGTSNSVIKFEGYSCSDDSNEIVLIKEEKADDYEHYERNSVFNTASMLTGEHISEVEFNGGMAGENAIGRMVQSGYPDWAVENQPNDASSFLNMSDKSMNNDTSQIYQTSLLDSNGKLFPHAYKRDDYYCPVCMLSFAHKRSVTRHMRSVHTVNGERLKFRCELCQKLYTRRDNLRTHMRMQHGTTTAPEHSREEGEEEEEEGEGDDNHHGEQDLEENGEEEEDVLVYVDENDSDKYEEI